jgi:hypothetical protein
MRSTLLALLVVFVLGQYLPPLGSENALGDGPDDGAGDAATGGEQAQPRELLVGTWKRTVSIDKTRLEDYLKHGGGLKVSLSRKELLAGLQKTVATEVTMEFHADGTMLETTKLPDAKARALQYQWKLLEGEPGNLQLELAHTGTKGRDKVRVVYRPTIAFRGRNQFVMKDQQYERKALTSPVWDRVQKAPVDP